MGIGIIYAFASEPAGTLFVIQKVVGVIDTVAAFQEDGTAVAVIDDGGSLFHILFAVDLHISEDLAFWYVWSRQLSHREKYPGEGGDRLILYELGACWWRP